MRALMAQQRPLLERLPQVRGRLTQGASLASITWFRAGGAAEVLFKPADLMDLQGFLERKPEDVPVTVLGVGSNLLVRDGGIPGVVLRLGRAFAEVRVNGTQVIAGAAALDLNVALAARDGGVGGLEFLSGVPGTIGGALRMNAGAYGSDMAAVVTAATAIDAHGRLRKLDRDALGFTYRHSGVEADWIFVGAELEGRTEQPASIQARITEIQTARAESQPIRARTGGSTFTNPPHRKAWELIDAAGCRGLKVGEAMVSEKHCNFLINTGAATAADLEALGEEVRRRVQAQSGVELHWEIKRIGVPADSPLAVKVENRE
jgi:UDP-N-acetylmuramate dehydrogenase